MMVLDDWVVLAVKGPAPMSEPETRAVAQTILKYNYNIRIYLTFHSYGKRSMG